MSKASRARRKAAKGLRTRGMTAFKDLDKPSQNAAILEEFDAMLTAIKKGIRLEMRLGDSFYENWDWAKSDILGGKARAETIQQLALELLAEARYRCRHKSFPVEA